MSTSFQWAGVFSRFSTPLIIQSTILSLILFSSIILLSNPQLTSNKQTIKKNWIDIVIALDVSTSMDADDLPPSRLEVAKKMLEWFTKSITSDRVGLVVFAGKPFVSIPLTFDTEIIDETIKNTTTQTINQYMSDLWGTSIGDALLMSRNMFQQKDKNNASDTQSREKVVILITDGDANRGVEPTIAWSLLTKDHIKVYSIGIGSASGWTLDLWNGQIAQIPALKGEELQKLSNVSWGKYFRALDGEGLQSVFQELSKLQKHDIEVSVTLQYTPFYQPFVLLITLLLIGYVWILFSYHQIVWNSKN